MSAFASFLLVAAFGRDDDLSEDSCQLATLIEQRDALSLLTKLLRRTGS